ncbi:glycosyltransferase family 2 protein [Pantoea sp. Cy-640]|uniref:glycosyltransferase family 2 protein n=1 Tax=Pantoea sp. Cy-640 TaxID=2608353 RepID=UPI00141A60D7|nr:glycosyltransferase family 2 protein [Pantoea sp. Cy-640]NIG14640.1 hypothetical protein [Pantoea sp. Cy-640]
MNILVLAAGENYIDSSDKDYPLCLTEFNGTPLIQKISEKISFNMGLSVFLFQEKHIKKHHLDNIVQLLSNGLFKSFPVPENTAGAACTALLGVVGLPQDEPLMIVSANQFLDIDYQHFYTVMKENNYDAGTVVFDSIHPRYSYVLLDESNLVIEASEKNPVSRNATAGVYWFSTTRDFSDAVKNMIRKDARVNDNFYICPAFNELILKNKKIGVVRIDKSKYHPLKTKSQFESNRGDL